MQFLLLALVLLLVPMLAEGQEGTLTNRGAGSIVIWRSESAWKDGQRLIDAGQATLVKRAQIACVIQAGTRVVKLAGGYTTNRVTVIEGPSRGCEGYAHADVDR